VLISIKSVRKGIVKLLKGWRKKNAKKI